MYGETLYLSKAISDFTDIFLQSPSYGFFSDMSVNRCLLTVKKENINVYISIRNRQNDYFLILSEPLRFIK